MYFNWAWNLGWDSNNILFRLFRSYQSQQPPSPLLFFYCKTQFTIHVNFRKTLLFSHSLQQLWWLGPSFCSSQTSTTPLMWSSSPSFPFKGQQWLLFGRACASEQRDMITERSGNRMWCGFRFFVDIARDCGLPWGVGVYSLINICWFRSA